MRRLFVVILLVFASAAEGASQSHLKLEIGAKLPKQYVSSKNNLIMTGASQLRSFVEVTIGKVEFLVAYDKETNKIKYIHTTDVDFQNSNGLKIDDEITFTREQLEIFPFWEIRVLASKDGWFPVIALDMPMFGGDFISKLKEGESATMTISGFSKGSN